MRVTKPIMAEIKFAKGSAVWCQTTPVNYHDAVVLEDCVEGDAEAVVRYTTAARIMRGSGVLVMMKMMSTTLARATLFLMSGAPLLHCLLRLKLNECDAPTTRPRGAVIK